MDRFLLLKSEEEFERCVGGACRVMLVQGTSATHVCRNAGQANRLSNKHPRLSGVNDVSAKVRGQELSLYHTFHLSPPMFPEKTERREATEHRG